MNPTCTNRNRTSEKWSELCKQERNRLHKCQNRTCQSNCTKITRKKVSGTGSIVAPEVLASIPNIAFLTASIIVVVMNLLVRNQLSDYELREFFRSLQDLLALSLNANLSVDSVEFLSLRLDGFERALSVLSLRVHVSHPSERNCFLTLTFFCTLSVNKGSIV